jgi:hypothetical protein
MMRDNFKVEHKHHPGVGLTIYLVISILFTFYIAFKELI